MGSQAIQGKLWGQRADDWAAIQEPTGMAGYIHALQFLQLSSNDELLDVGCGTGLFSSIAAKNGTNVTGIDAGEELIAEAGNEARLWLPISTLRGGANTWETRQ